MVFVVNISVLMSNHSQNIQNVQQTVNLYSKLKQNQFLGGFDAFV
jgi:hypothetical protein